MAKSKQPLLLTTTAVVEGRPVVEYIDVVAGQSIIGVNAVKDLFASIRDLVGGHSKTYERTLDKARNEALKRLEDRAAEMGADAVIGIDIDFSTMGPHGGLIMVSASGTAVKLGTLADRRTAPSPAFTQPAPPPPGAGRQSAPYESAAPPAAAPQATSTAHSFPHSLQS